MYHSRCINSAPLTLIALFTLYLMPNPAAATSAKTSYPASVADLGGLYLPADDPDRVRPAPLVGTEINVSISGIVVRTRVRQVFRNPDKVWTEAIYTYPLPPDSAVDRLRMTVGGRVIDGRIAEKIAARQAYTQAKRSGRKASLVEQQRPNIFTTSLANLGPGESVTVEIGFQELLSYRDGGFQWRMPLVVGPRYIPGRPLKDGFQPTGWSPATGRVPDAPLITPPVRSAAAGRGNPVTLRIDLDAGFALSELRSPTHAIRIEDTGIGRRLITLDGDAVPAVKDVILNWRPKPGAAPRAGLFAESWEGQRYALMMVMPPVGGLPDAAPLPARPAREVVYVIDTSGSMHGDSMGQARAALHMALDRLTPRDRFQIIRFAHGHTAFRHNSVPASPANLARARGFVDNLTADGGTEIAGAMRAALARQAPKGPLRQVVLITDGAVGNEEEMLKLIDARLGRSRLFTVGIGSAPNGYLMTRAARAGRGTYTFIPTAVEVASKMTALFKRLERPALTDITLQWPKGAKVDVTPQPIPDLYLGEPVVVLARLGDGAGSLKVSGRFGDAVWETAVNLSGGRNHPGVAALWGRTRIRRLMDDLRRAEDRTAVRTAIVQTALSYKLVSKFTSLIAVDNTPSRPADQPLAQTPVPTNMPDGWNRDAVFGKQLQTPPVRTFDPTSPALRKILALGGATSGVPQTATSAPLLRFAGLLVLMAALLAMLVLLAMRRRQWG